jgi:hypothetical protein
MAFDFLEPMESLLIELSQAVQVLRAAHPSTSPEMRRAARAAEKATLYLAGDYHSLWLMEREDAISQALAIRRARRGAPGTYRVARHLPVASPIRAPSIKVPDAFPVGASALPSPISLRTSADSPV